MSDLISREKLEADMYKACFEEDSYFNKGMQKWDSGNWIRYKVFEEVLLKQPSAEKTGKWIRNDNGTYSCSLCKSWIPQEQYYYARFCLHCGARMVN